MSCSVISSNLRTSSGDKHTAPLYPQPQRVLPDGGTGAAACAAALIVHVGVEIYLVRTRALTIHQTRTRRGYGVVTAAHNVVVVPRKT